MNAQPIVAAQALAEAATELDDPTYNFVCVWVGDRYPREYVEIWADQVLRNSTRINRALWAVTDRPDELPEGIEPIAADPAIPPSYWAKLQLFSPAMPWAKGERVIYFDLDICVTGRLEDLVERKGIARDAGWPTYNSSVMVWDAGGHAEAWTRFTPDIMTRSPGPLVEAQYLPAGTPNAGDQEWLSELGGWDLLPAEWVVSFKWQAKDWPPNGAKVVQFHGEPKPSDLMDGWVPNVWKIGGYTSLPEMNGVNTTHDHIKANIRSAVERNYPWFSGFRETGRRCVIVGGAPSVKDYITDIRWHARQGAQIVSVNNTWRFLAENGITPGVHVMCDARPENAEFVKGAPDGVKYLLASQCDPATFDALDGKDVIVWHCGFGDNSVLKDILSPWWDEGPNQRPCVLVPGGGTVTLRALWLAALSGFRTIHLYGVDSSYTDTGSHHAYAQPLNDNERIMEVAMRAADGTEKRYRASPWQVRQAEEFKQHWAELKREGVTLHVHGRGLLPDIAATLKAEERG